MTRLLRRGWVRTTIGLVVVVAIVGGGYATYAATTGGPAGYRTAVATRGDVEQTLALSGTVSQLGRSDLAFSASGTVTQVVKTGRHVKKGQVVARLDATSLRKAVIQARAAVAADRAQRASDEDTLADGGSTSSTSTSSTSTGTTTGGTSSKTAASAKAGSATKSAASAKSGQSTTPTTSTAAKLPTCDGSTSSADCMAAVQQVCTASQSPEPSESSTPTETAEPSPSSSTTSPSPSTGSSASSSASSSVTSSAGSSARSATGSATSSATTSPSATATPSASVTEDTVVGDADTDVALSAYIVARSAAPSGTAGKSGASGKGAASGTTNVTVSTTSCADALDDLQTYLEALDAALAQQSQASGTPSTGQSTSTSGSTGSTGGTGTSQPASTGTQATTPSTSTAGSGGSTATGSTATGSTGMQGGSVTEATIAKDEATLKSDQAELISARQALRGAVLRAPAAGKVAEADVAVGDSATSGTTAVVLVGKGLAAVSLSASSTQITELKVGQTARVTPAGATEAVTGTVTSVSNIPDSTDSTYPVIVTLAKRDSSLLMGTTAAVDVVVGTAKDAVTVPTSAVSNGSVEVLDGDTVQRVRVTVGIVGRTATVITDGIDEGQQVVLADLSQALPTGDSTQQTGFGGGSFGGGSSFGGTRPGR